MYNIAEEKIGFSTTIMWIVDSYGISVSQMTTDMAPLSETLPGPFLIHDL